MQASWLLEWSERAKVERMAIAGGLIAAPVLGDIVSEMLELAPTAWERASSIR